MAESVVKVAVAGLGGWGKNVLRSFARTKGAVVKAVCDADSAALDAQAPLVPDAKAVSSFDDILADGDIDAVAIVTPSPLHFTMARAALEAGKHVYVEKPLALSVADARALDALAGEKKRTLMVGHILEYHPAVGLLKELVDGGELGDFFYMYCQRLNLGVVRREENALWSLAPHDVSVILYLFGQEPDSVAAHGVPFLQDDVEDVVFVNLHFPDGRMAQIHISWLDPHKERKMVVVGSQKMAVFDDMQATEKVRVYNKAAEVKKRSGDVIEAITVRHGEIVIPLVPMREPLLLEAQHFVDCVRSGDRPRSDGADGVRVVKVLGAAAESLARNGVPVKVEQ